MTGNAISECPTDADLQRLLDDAQPTDETISNHVATCDDCQRQLDRLTDSAELAFYRRQSEDQRDAVRFLAPPLNDGDIGSLNDLAIERQIGAGGMGVVFQGRDAQLGRQVAVKILSRRSGSESDSRFRRESKAAAKLHHDHIVPVYSAGTTEDGTAYLVMQLIEGQSLKERIAAGTVTLREAASLVRQIALGLDSAHTTGLVHRDVKPGNILIDDNDGRAKLTDFGLARTTDDQTLTQANVVSGTPQYMSPEQISDPGTQDPRSDIYSLGITLYECLTGTSPFRGQPIQILEQHRHVEPIRPSRLNDAVPQDMDNICLMAIAKDPDRRYQTAGQFAKDLQRYLDGQPVVARETTRLEKFAMWCRRNRGVAALIAAVFGLLLTVGIGSTVAAWRLNSANKTILDEKQKATDAQQLAVNDRTAAIESLETLVNSLYDDLSNNAATIKTREKVVNAAIDGLKSITQAADSRKADRTTFQAYMRIGDLSSMRGSNEDAVENYDKAIELGKTLLNEKPDDPLTKRELGIAISKLGLHHFRSGNYTAANERGEECTELLQEVLNEHPDDFDALTRLVVQHSYKLAMIRQAAPLAPNQVIDYGETALQDIDRTFAIKQNNSMACEAAHSVHFCIGRGYLESGRPELANDHFVNARSYLDVALKQTPENVELRSASAVLDRAQAIVLVSLGQIESATESFENALQIMQQLSAANPEDIVRKKNVANTQAMLGMAYDLLGKHEDAIQEFDEVLQTFEEMLEQSPEDTSNLTQVVNVLYQKLTAQANLFRWAGAHETVNELSNVLDRGNFGPAGFIPYYRTVTKGTSEAAQWLLGNKPEAKTATGECVALMHGARQDAYSSTSPLLSAKSLGLVKRINPDFEGESFADLFEHISSLSGVFPLFAAQRKKFEASIFGLLAQNCSQSDDPDVQQRANEFLQQSLNVIRKMAAGGPAAVREPVFNNPDLKWVRQTQEFKDLLAELLPPDN